jgi:uncharacterized protein (DUF1330 family)
VPKGYWIGHIDVTEPGPNRVIYEKYRSLARPAVKKYGGKYLVRKGAFEVKEGASRAGHTLIEFESYEQALKAYNSPEYQEAKRLRVQAADTDIIVIEGFDDTPD